MMMTSTKQRVTAVLAVLLACACVPAAATAHGVASADYRALITSIKPQGLPIDIRVVNGDQLRIENAGSGELLVCGYGMEGDNGCEPYARIGAKGVDVNHNTRSYYANLDTTEFGDVPNDVGRGGPQWVHLHDLKFFEYHDHRTHWMGGKTLPPGVDSSNPKDQLVSDFIVNLKYNGKLVTVKGKLEYVGGRTWLQRNGELLVTGIAVLAMLLVFGFDARRRRKARRVRNGGDDAPGSGGGDAGARGAAQPTETVLLPEREQEERV